MCIVCETIGRLHQVEYAMEAITQAGTCVGVLTPEGVVLGAQKRVVSKLLETKGQRYVCCPFLPLFLLYTLQSTFSYL